MAEMTTTGVVTPDPTYIKSEIDADPIWALAWRLSELDNDNAPIGWYRYTNMSKWLLNTFHMEKREETET